MPLLDGGLRQRALPAARSVESALEHLADSDDAIRLLLWAELKARNSVLDGSEADYVKALWAEYKKLRVQRREELEMSFHGIPHGRP